MQEKHMPDAVTALLAVKWRSDKGGNTRRIAAKVADRGQSPSYYHVHKRIVDTNEVECLTFKEALALHQDGAFGGQSRLGTNGVVIFEHAKHSLEEFFSDVMTAWDAHQARLKDLAPTEKAHSEPSPRDEH